MCGLKTHPHTCHPANMCLHVDLICWDCTGHVTGRRDSVLVASKMTADAFTHKQSQEAKAVKPPMTEERTFQTGKDHQDCIIWCFFSSTVKNHIWNTMSSSIFCGLILVVNRGLTGNNSAPLGHVLTWKYLYKAVLSELFSKYVGKQSQAQRFGFFTPPPPCPPSLTWPSPFVPHSLSTSKP